MSTAAMPPPAATGPGEADRHPFTGPQVRPVDAALRGPLARLTPLQEAVWRLRRGVGTAGPRPCDEVAILLSMPEMEVRRTEAEAARRLTRR